MHRPAVGDRVSNYLLDERIGAGSFGEVWKAHHHVFAEIVAVKIPTDPQYVRNLRHEGVAIHGLHHPNIVRAIDLDPYAETPYLIMEYVDGPSLRQVLAGHLRGLSMPTVFAVMQGLFSALEAAHAAGVIHRDVKPENILIAGHENLEGMVPARVKVTDFGLGRAGGLTTASMMQSGSLTTEEGKSISGTIAYMSPEQREGRPIDARSDLYSCGIVLFEMLTGSRPEGTDLPSRVRSDVPKRMDALFQTLYTRRDWRIASAGDAIQLLADAGRSDGPDAILEYGGPNPLRVSRASPPHTGQGPDALGRPGDTTPRCPACGQDVADTDQFCIHCGAQLVNRLPGCPACGGRVHKDDRYCIFCGERQS